MLQMKREQVINMCQQESALYKGLSRGGCSLMGEEVTPTLISRYESAMGNTQDKLNVITVADHITPKIDKNGVGFTLESRDYKNPQVVTYRKKGHPQTTDQGQGWERAEVNDTLNAFDNGESRTPTLVLENHPADSRVKVSEDGIVQTLSSRMGTGGVILRWWQKL